MRTPNSDRTPSYFARPLVQGAVLGAFGLLTVPLALALLASEAGDASAGGESAVSAWLPLYTVTFGTTHFLLTGLLYLDSRNLRYFNSSRRNQWIYFGIPLAIFALLDGVAALGLRAQFAWLDLALFQFVFLANFLHVSRQSFGMLQLFKHATRRLYGEALRSAESMFFFGLALLQAETLWSGRVYAPNQLGVQLTTGLVVGLFALVVGMHARLLRAAAPGERAWVPTLYFVLQAVAGALAVWKTSLYGVALAMHYVEYHVVMAPRVFASPVEPVERAQRADRIRRWRSTSKVVAYGGLLAVGWSLWFVQRTELYLDPQATSVPMRFALHALDGLFVAHFFIETFVWRFSKPHYRDTLGPLYFAPRVQGGAS